MREGDTQLKPKHCRKESERRNDRRDGETAMKHRAYSTYVPNEYAMPSPSVSPAPKYGHEFLCVGRNGGGNGHYLLF